MGGVLSSPLMPMQIVSAPITRDELRRIAGQQFGDFVKAVVDVQGGVMAIGAELHADEEALLLEQGARQADLWGINLYPDRANDELIEFDRSRGVDDAAVQALIQAIVGRLVAP